MKDLLKAIAKSKRGASETNPGSVIPLLEKLVLSRTLEGRFDPDWGGIDVFHPSEISGGFCPRLLEISRVAPNSLKKGKRHSTGLQRIFDVGTSLHFWYQNFYFGPAGILWGKWLNIQTNEVRIGFQPEGTLAVGSFPLPLWLYTEPAVYNAEYSIGGHIDGILKYTVGSKDYTILWDLKTSKSGSFRAAKSNGPWPKYLKQIALYFDCTPVTVVHSAENEPGNDLGYSVEPYSDFDGFDGMQLMYVNKDTSEEEEFWVSRKEVDLEQVYSDLNVLTESRKKFSLPQRLEVCESPQSKIAKSCIGCRPCFNYGKNRAARTELREDHA